MIVRTRCASRAVSKRWAAAVACSKRLAASAATWRCSSAAAASARQVATFHPPLKPTDSAARPAAAYIHSTMAHPSPMPGVYVTPESVKCAVRAWRRAGVANEMWTQTPSAINWSTSSAGM